jgi:hypothetical protein
MFFMGTDFRKLKAPFVWYDILHVLDVLSSCSWLKGDPRLLNMANLVKSKADAKANTRLNRNGKLGAAGISPRKNSLHNGSLYWSCGRLEESANPAFVFLWAEA